MRQELSKRVVFDGVPLTLMAIEIGNDEWELAVENELGIRTTWYEIFPSPHSAFTAGMRAIELEGVDEFAGNEGFEYPPFNKSPPP